jgi:acyl phosphate:glycerol-3-phosphate acyltransferase
MFLLGCAVAGYLIGAIPFGYLIAKSRGVDILRAGSGNIGATNVGRVLGRKLGLLVFALDFAKGAVPAAVARALAAADEAGVAAGLAAFLGHMFPVYLCFRGGKGVATGAGVVAVLVPGPAAGALLVWLAVAAAARFVSLASVAAALALAGLRLVTAKDPFGSGQVTLTLFCLAGAALVVARHRSNLARLIRGTENRLPEDSPVRHVAKPLHILALAVWCGSAVFFSFIAAPAVFRNFEEIATEPPDQRPSWLPLRADYDSEQGKRLAGLAVGPLFGPFFQLQFICGVIAVVTASCWVTQPGRVHRLRLTVALAALLSVVVGWLVAGYVSTLRLERYADGPAAEAAKAAFGPWHGVSLGLQFVTVLLVLVVTALAAWLPAEPAQAGGQSAKSDS